MAELRRLNSQGMAELTDFLNRVKQEGEATRVPAEILTDERTSEALPLRIDVESKAPADRMTTGRYFYTLFSGNEATPFSRDPGIWSWLSLYYFDELCMRRKNGTLDPGELARWLPSDNSRRYYRHLLAGPYLIYRAYMHAPETARIVLCQAVQNPGNFVGQLASRQDFIRNRAVVEAATILYFDESTGNPKPGAQSDTHRAGTLLRYVDVINQFDLTWDLYSMSGEDLVSLLPCEFDRYKPPHLRRSQ